MNSANSTRIPVRRALISVFKKDGVLELARGLAGVGCEILSTGGTAALLRTNGVAVRDVAEETGFPEMMDGRVKTLHPKIHGALLMRRDQVSHVEAARSAGIRPIDLVVVNLYPFSEAASRPAAAEAEVIEMIDIGGPSMVRSAAKNFEFTTVLTDPADYPEFLLKVQEQGGVDLKERRRLSAKAFASTSAYDAAIAEWMNSETFLPDVWNLSLTRRTGLRYGENPHQRAALYTRTQPPVASIPFARMHSGKELSYNNYLDADAALNCVREMDDPAAVIIKHKNPCGAAVDPNLEAAFLGAWDGDPLSAYGGIVALNRPMTESLARLIAVKERFFEVIVAPAYEGASLEILQNGAKWGRNVRILELTQPLRGVDSPEKEIRWIQGGYLVQDPDLSVDTEFQVVTRRTPTPGEFADLKMAWTLCRFVTSNAIVYVKNRQLVAAGAGQMSRVDSVEIAARKGGAKCRGAVMASDAFFPFADGIQAAAAAGIRAVIHPGGSIRDDQVLAEADRLDLAMVLTGRRHFRH